MKNTIVIVLQKMKYGKYHCKYSYFGCCKQNFEWLEFQAPLIGLQMYSGRLDEHD
jgi:hypothetical protein